MGPAEAAATPRVDKAVARARAGRIFITLLLDCRPSMGAPGPPPTDALRHRITAFA